MSSLKIRAGRLARRLAENQPWLEGLVRTAATRPRVERGDGFIQKVGGRYVVISPRNDADDTRVGIYLRGACDLPAVFAMTPLLRDNLTGTYCIARDPIQISGSRSDFLLERLQPRSPEVRESMKAVARRLNLPPTYFGDDLFRAEIVLHQLDQEKFPKTLAVLSTSADFSRTLYRHREHGFLVDPGGFWLDTDLVGAVSDPETLMWFRDNFQSVGRMKRDEFVDSFGRLVEEVRRRTGARILVFNMLTVDPSDSTHSYRLVRDPDTVRRREFSIALAELSQTHDFEILDVDRILKLGGITEQVDFAHFSESQFRPIGEEVYRVLTKMGLA